MSNSTTVESESRPPPRKRLRARKACLPCRQRKRKCDVQYPCSMCTTYGYSCQYDEDDGPTAAFVHNPPPTRTKSRSDDSSPQAIPVVKRTLEVETPQSFKSQEPGLLDPVKTRYVGLHSVMAFPRNLGVEFQSANPPRLHSFGWNCGLRQEEEMRSHEELRTIVSIDEFKKYFDTYLYAVHPVWAILDEAQISAMAQKYWAGTLSSVAFEAILAGVIALGSFFSVSLGHPKELQIVRHAREVLEDSALPPSVEAVCAWILRTIYLRLTTRPHRSWMASCTAMHIAEATGVHHDISSVVLTNGKGGGGGGGRCTAGDHQTYIQPRRIFWTAHILNKMISYEYGRSAITLMSISCQRPPSTHSDCLPSLIAISELIPSGSATHLNLQETLTHLSAIPTPHPFLKMAKSDLSMSLYRHHRLLKRLPEKEALSQIINIGNAAIETSLMFARSKRFWWNTICTTFQFVCVLLAMDTPESLANVENAVEKLDLIAGLVNTHLAREACGTARVLLRDSVGKKRREVEMLEAVDFGAVGDGEVETQVGGEMDGNVNVNVNVNLDIDWDALLDPWFMSTFAGQDFVASGSEAGGSGFVSTL